jgi:hypothetical protein
MRSYRPLIAATLAAPILLAALGEARAFDADDLNFDVRLEQRYEDNILELDDRNLERIDRQSGTERYGVETPDDFVTRARFRMGYEFRVVPRRETDVRAEIESRFYARNDVKNHEVFSLDLSQEISASRRNLSSFHVSWDTRPDFFHRNLTDDDASFLARERIRRGSRYDQSRLILRFEQEVVDGRLDAWVAHRWRWRDFNRAFDERDNERRTWELGIEGRPTRWYDLRIGARYQQGELVADGDLPSTIIFDDDISYDRETWRVWVRQGWGDRLRGWARVEVGGETRSFTTTNAFDRGRFGREDDRVRFRIAAAQRLTRNLELRAEWAHQDSDAGYPDDLVGFDDRTDFVQNRFTFGVRMRFDGRDARRVWASLRGTPSTSVASLR